MGVNKFLQTCASQEDYWYFLVSDGNNLSNLLMDVLGWRDFLSTVNGINGTGSFPAKA